jgi:hypothetical protein
MTWLEGLKKDTPKLGNAHLHKYLSLALVREDTALVISIQKILHAESIRCHWQSIQQAAIPTRGGAVTWLTVPHPAGDNLYAIREGVESQGMAAIETRYKVAGGAPILQDARLRANFGFLYLRGKIHCDRYFSRLWSTHVLGAKEIMRCVCQVCHVCCPKLVVNRN